MVHPLCDSASNRNAFPCLCSCAHNRATAPDMDERTAPPAPDRESNPRHVLRHMALCIPGGLSLLEGKRHTVWLSDHGLNEHVSGQVFLFSCRRSAIERGNLQERKFLREKGRTSATIPGLGLRIERQCCGLVSGLHIYLYSTSSPCAPPALHGASPVHSLSRRALKPLVHTIFSS